MTNDLGLTLVMGARGAVGRLVLDQLRASGHAVRASARTVWEDMFAPGVDAVSADLTDPRSLATAFAGVDQVFLYAIPGTAGAAVEAAAVAGVRTMVLLSSGSVLLPSCTANPITVEHREAEEDFARGELELVPIRPLVLATNDLWWSRDIRSTGEVTLYQPDGASAPVHEADIAAVAVAALGGARGQVSEILTGPGLLTQRERVAAIASRLGRTLGVREQTREDELARLSAFMPTEEADAILQFHDDTAAGNSPATATVSDVLGRPGTTYDRWVSDHLGEFG